MILLPRLVDLMVASVCYFEVYHGVVVVLLLLSTHSHDPC